jgi:hypothetical protein
MASDTVQFLEEQTTLQGGIELSGFDSGEAALS